MMFLPDPEYPWKWNWRLDGQPSEYLGFSTVGSGTILHKEHLKHFCISASSPFSRDKAISLLFILNILKTDRRSTSTAESTLQCSLYLGVTITPIQVRGYHVICTMSNNDESITSFVGTYQADLELKVTSLKTEAAA